MSFKGKKHSIETIQKMSNSKLGNKSKMGQKDSLETREKKSMAQKSEKHHRWVGNNPSYEALHQWVKRNSEKSNCIKCSSTRFVELSNISGDYKRDLNDWQWLCSKCHKAFDKGRNSIIRKYGKMINPWSERKINWRKHCKVCKTWDFKMFPNGPHATGMVLKP